MKNIKSCSEDMACKHGIQLCIHIMQSKTQILEHKANTVKEHAPRLRSNARMEIALCKKKRVMIYATNFHSSVFIYFIVTLSYKLQKEVFLPIQTVQTQNKCLFISA